jgi:predicted flap endonuclease-1-like 5' DNA nuclease
LFCSDSTGGLTPVNATAGAVVESEEESDGEDEDEEKDEKPVRMNRRNRSSSGSGEFVGNPDLLKIPGVGLRNQRKLVDNGIGDVAELKKLYKDKVLLNLQFLTCGF